MTPPRPNNAWTRDVPWIDRDDADIGAYVASVANAPSYDLAAKLHEWRERGVVIFEGVVAQADIDATLADIEHFRTHFREYNIPLEVRGRQLESGELDASPLGETGVKINHLHCFSRAAARLSLTPEVVNFLSHIFGGPAAVTQSLTFWRGSEQPIHIDYPYVRQQKRLAYVAASWTPLEDVHPEAGPLAYYPGGHKLERSGFYDWGGGSITHDAATSLRTPMDFAHHLRERMETVGLKRVDFCPRRGDVLIWHGNLPHEGSKVIDPARTRKSFVTHYTSLADMPEWMRAPGANPPGAFDNGGFAYEFPWLSGRMKLPSSRT